MAFDSDKTGKSIADFVKDSKPAPGVPITDADLVTLWRGIINILYTDMIADGVVLPDSFTDSLAVLITGTGKLS